jgi:hypothetical protein
MKTSTLLVLFLLVVTVSHAQTRDTTSTTRLRNYEFPDTPRHDVDLQLFGPALAISLNYERRFINKNNEFGIRTGFGISWSDSVKSVLAVPLQGYCRLGTKENHLEIGAGVTYLHAVGISGSIYDLNSLTKVKIPADKGDILVPTTSVGVRFAWYDRYYTREGGRTSQYISVGATAFYTFGQLGLVPYLSFGGTF